MVNFIIVAEVRTGYQLLATSLNNHPDILCLGEIFKCYRNTRQESLFTSPIPVIEEDQSSVAYVENVLLPYASDRKAFGFKLNYVCARTPTWSGLWDYVRDGKWHVIHLCRKNCLDRIISEKLAVAQKRWNHKVYNNEKIVLTKSQIDASYRRSLNWQKEAREFFKNNEVLELFYEDLECDSSRPYVLGKVQSFLGVTPITLSTFMIKQRVGSQSLYVENYRQLYLECRSDNVYRSWFTDEVMPKVM